MQYQDAFKVLNPYSKRVIAGIVLNCIGRGMTLSLTLVYFHSFRGFSNSFGGLVLGGVTLVSLFASGPIGTAIDRFGPRVVAIQSLLFCTISSIGLSLVSTKVEAILALLGFAIGTRGIWPSQTVILTRVTSEAERDRIYGLQFMMVNLGIGLGSVIAALVIQANSLISFQLLYWGDGITYLIYIAIILSLGKLDSGTYQTRHISKEQGSYREVFAIKKVALLTFAAVVLLTFNSGSVQAALPLFATQYLKLSPKWLGIFFGFNCAAIVIIQPFITNVFDRFNKYRALALVGIIWAGSWLVVGSAIWLPTFFAGCALCISQVIYAVGEAINAPVNSSILQELSPEHVRGRMSSLVALQWGVADVIGPILAGLMIGHALSLQWAYLMCTGSLVSVPIYLFAKRSR